MKVGIIGSGGREHAYVTLSKSKKLTKFIVFQETLELVKLQKIF